MRSWIPIALVVAFGFGLRIPGIFQFSLEQDELYTVREGTLLFDVDLEPGIEGRPLYFLLQHLLLEILPTTPPGIRVVPLLFGVLGIWMTWKLAALLFGRAAGLTAALLVAISPWHMYISGMARYWSLIYLLSVASCYFLVRAYADDRPRDWIAALLLLMVGTGTHPTFLFPMVGVALAFSVVKPTGKPGWSWPSRRGFTHLWLPFAGALGAAFLALRLTDEEDAFQNWGGRGWLSTLRLVPAVVEWLTPAVVLAGTIGAILLLRMKVPTPARRWGAMAVLGFFSSLTLLTIASFRTDVYSDYATAALPFIFISAGALLQLGVDRLPRGSAAWGGGIAVALLIASVAPAAVSHLLSGTRFDYRPAFEHIRQTAPEVTVLTWPLIVQRHYAPDLQGLPVSVVPANLDRALGEEGDLWIIASMRRFGIVADDEGRLADWLQDKCRREASFEDPRFDYRQYRVDLHRCRAPAPTPTAGTPATATTG